jgi:conjugative relaxase-like TrwC/TraI family protein
MTQAMVTVHKLTGVSAGGAVVDYFFDMEKQRSTGDYYAGPSGEPVECPGAWLGKLAARLGMSGDVTVEQLLHLLDGRHPETSERLVPFRKDRVAGHDLTFSAPKSVSAAWALASASTRRAIEDAQTAAVAEALAYLESRIPVVRRTENGELIAETAAEVIAVAFVHHTSRQTAQQAECELPPDPQVHTHVLLPMARRHDGRLVAITSRPLFDARQEVEAVYQSALATGLAQLGFAIDRGTGRRQRYFEISGIPEDLRTDWSSRDREITGHTAMLKAAFRTQYGRDPSVVELRDLNVRHRIAKGRSYADPATFWRAVGVAHGVSAETIEGLRRQGRPSLADRREQMVRAVLGEDGLTARHAVVDTRRLHIVAFQRAAGLLTVAETEQTLAALIDQGEVVGLGKDRWTTREMLGLETQVIAWANHRRGLPPPPRPAAIQVWQAIRAVQRDRDVTLSSEQLDAFRAMLGNRFTAVTGEAGVGKGVVLHAAAVVWRAQQRRVFAVAVAGATAQRLAADLGEGAEAMTLAGLITRLEHGRLQLRPDDVIAIDEAGMVGTRQWARATAAIGEMATVVAVGDAAQLSSLSAGGLWPILAADGPRLTGIRRTELPWERDAWHALREGQAASALTAYAQQGYLTMSATRADALQAAVTAWDTDGRTGLIVTDASNAERHRANHQAQQRRMARGELGRAALTVATECGDVELHVADRIIFSAQWHLGHGVQRVENGTTGSVVAVDDPAATLTVRTHEPSPRELHIPATAASMMVDLAYTAHVYKAQGATVDRVYVVAGGWQTDRENLYVACSRSRRGTQLFVDRQSLGRVTDPAALEELVKRGARSRAKQAAHKAVPLSPTPPRPQATRPRKHPRRVLTSRRPLVDAYHRRQRRRAAAAATRRRAAEATYAKRWPAQAEDNAARVAAEQHVPAWVVRVFQRVTGIPYARR